MDEFIVTKTERYTVRAESLDDARFVWRRFETNSEFEDDVEFLDGANQFDEKEKGNE